MRTCAGPFLLFAATLWCVACTQLPPSRADLQAKQFEVLPDRAVIYILRDAPDFSQDGASLLLDGTMTITTYPGTYYRWEVAPGTHRIAGFAADAGNATMNVEASRIYFVQQRFASGPFGPRSSFYHVPPDRGRAIVMRS
jgi:hypothetical protein